VLFAAVCVAAQSGQPAAPDLDEKGAKLSGHRLELRGMEDTLEASQEQRRQIEAEIASIRADRAKLTAALLDATQNVNASERKIGENRGKARHADGSGRCNQALAHEPRAVITEVLASLQRMGRKPPPALLVTPEDMLAAIRTSMLLGSVLPQMRSETEALASDLSDLLQLRQSIAAERETLSHGVAKLRAERQRLAALVEARQSALSAAEQALGAERERRSNSPNRQRALRN